MMRQTRYGCTYHCRRCSCGESHTSRRPNEFVVHPTDSAGRFFSLVLGFDHRLSPARIDDEGLAYPSTDLRGRTETPPSCVTDTRTHLVLVESIGPAPAEGAVNLVGSELGESREASDQQLRCIGARILAQAEKPGSGPKIRIPKSPYGLNLNERGLHV